jgi:FG-GAP repeat
MRRVIGILLLTGLLLVFVWPLSALAAGSQSTGATTSRVALRADFNGDGAADLAIGAPGENNSAGAVHVLYGSAPTGLTATGSQLWSQNSAGIAGNAESGDIFGFALTAGDFNGDGAADLAIGAPGENDFAGLVHVLYGSEPAGLTATGSQLWWQNSPGIAGDTEPGDEFGSALTAGDFNGDTQADLAIGAPGENDFAGLVHVLYGSPTGLTAAGSQLWWQNSAGIADVTEPGDGFGFALAAGDFNGDTQADLAIGAPGENGFAGLVHVLYGSEPAGLTATGSQLWWQNSPGIAGGSEPDDIFGEALAAGDFNGDGAADLAIGAPGENDFAGLAHVLYGSAAGLTATGSQAWSQNSPGIADVAEASDVFGETLAAGTLSIDGDGTANPAATSPAERSRTARERRP